MSKISPDNQKHVKSVCVCVEKPRRACVYPTGGQPTHPLPGGVVDIVIIIIRSNVAINHLMTDSW